MDGYVVCTACGTRIKAGREFCLKCFEPLPHPDEQAAVPLSVSLGLSREKQIVFGVIALAIVAALVGVIWSTELPAPDDTSTAVAPSTRIPSAPAGDLPVAAGASATGEAGDELPMPQPPRAVTRDPDAAVDQDLERKRAEYLGVIGRTPNSAPALNKYGLLLAQLGENDEALKQFDRAIAAQSRTPEYRINLANLAAGMGLWGRAIDQYRETLLLTPRDYTVEYALAVALQRKGDDTMAVAEFEKARRLRPTEATVALGLGASLERLGRKDEATREYRKFLEMAPHAPEAAAVTAYLTKHR